MASKLSRTRRIEVAQHETLLSLWGLFGYFSGQGARSRFAKGWLRCPKSIGSVNLTKKLTRRRYKGVDGSRSTFGASETGLFLSRLLLSRACLRFTEPHFFFSLLCQVGRIKTLLLFHQGPGYHQHLGGQFYPHFGLDPSFPLTTSELVCEVSNKMLISC